ncbi:MAG: alpha-L-arabinofuranosidase C-terminal domain-containing protein [Thermomicrobiales bacterium]
MTLSARLKIDRERTIGRIDPRIYGGFIEHLGRCIYGGVYDEGSPLADEHGFRTDVMEAVAGLHMPILRWPGGNFVSGYHWTDGIGPKDERPRRIELAWRQEESNRFGTDEFIHYCRAIGAEPYICVNMGTGTIDEAQNWVEYCNGTGNTYWANLRRQNGHEEPYNVRYWGLGNEMYGNWQIGATEDPHDYVKRAREFAKVMLWIDPTIELVSCGLSGWQDWDSVVVAGLAKYIRYHSIHIYTGSDDVTENVLEPAMAEYAIEAAAGEIQRIRVQNDIKHDIKVAYDEWNVWYRTNSTTHLEERYTLSDALAVASYLNGFVRQADHIAIANLAQLVNVIAPLFTSPDGMFAQSIYGPLTLAGTYLQGTALDAWYDGPRIGVKPDSPRPIIKRLAKLGDFPMVDAAAALQDDGSTVVLSLVNRSADEAVLFTADFGDDAVAKVLGIDEVNGPDVMAINDFGAERTVGIASRESDATGRAVTFDLAPHSHTVIRFALA